MKIKFFSVIALLVAFAASGFAGDFVRIDLNFWGSDAAVTAVGKLPAGVRIGKKTPFNNKKLYGFATPIFVDIGKAPKFEITLKIKGKAGVIRPSVQPCRGSDGKFPEFECLEFEFNGNASTKAPLKFKAWTNMELSTEVDDGDTVTLKVEFKPAAE